jgi:type IV pilus assembly protein PilV
VATEPSPRADAGFSLVEVLIAMIILSVGLLALEALGIGAARSVRRASVQSDYAATAQALLERTVARVSATDSAATTNIADTSYTGAGGERVFRTATFVGIPGTTRNGVAGTTLKNWTITVRVLPPVNLGVLDASDSVRMVSNVIR